MSAQEIREAQLLVAQVLPPAPMEAGPARPIRDGQTVERGHCGVAQRTIIARCTPLTATAALPMGTATAPVVSLARSMISYLPPHTLAASFMQSAISWRRPLQATS